MADPLKVQDMQSINRGHSLVDISTTFWPYVQL